MKSEKILERLNEQLNFEIESAYIYLAMASYTNEEDYEGFTNFFEKQAQEEMEHAFKLKNFLQECGHQVKYEALPAPKADYSSILNVFEEALHHEEEVTRRIHTLMDEAKEAKDYRAMSLLQWYVDEQVEEEDNFNALVVRLKRIGESSAGMYILNGELARR